MKANIITIIVILIAILFNSCKSYDNDYNNQVIEAQAIALDKAARLIEKHNLFDADGSDLMDEYLAAYNRVDSLYNIQH